MSSARHAMVERRFFDVLCGIVDCEGAWSSLIGHVEELKESIPFHSGKGVKSDPIPRLHRAP